MTLILTHEVALAREVRREMAKDIVWFVQKYFRDEDGAKFRLKDFQIEGLRLCASDEERVMIEWPAAFGKSTHVSKHYPLHVLCLHPNAQILLGCQTQSHAESRLGVIRAEMLGNEELGADFGPFVGELWRDDEINVAQRTVIAKDPSVGIFGAGSSIMGRRATHVIADDLVTIENSGPNVEEATRARVSQQWNDGIKKVGYPGKPLYLRVINTVVDLRDLVHELAAVNGHVPEDPGMVRWRSTKRYLVIRRGALDETAGTSLWPERRSVESLLEEKAEDTLSFLRRMQNLCLDPATLNFRREWFYGREGDATMPGCLDWNRVLGELPTGDGVPAFSRAGAYDPAYRETEQSSWCAYAEVGFDRKGPEPRRYYLTDLWRFRAQVMEQEAFLCDRVEGRGLAILHIEENAAQQWLLQLPRLRSLILSGHRIEGHNTNVRTKYEPDTGLPALAGIVRGGLLRFPYGDARSRQQSDLAIGEFLAYPQGATKDLLMAIWMSILGAQKLVRAARAGIIERAISPLLLRHGITAAVADRYYPPRKLVS